MSFFYLIVLHTYLTGNFVNIYFNVKIQVETSFSYKDCELKCRHWVCKLPHQSLSAFPACFYSKGVLVHKISQSWLPSNYIFTFPTQISFENQLANRATGTNLFITKENKRPKRFCSYSTRHRADGLPMGGQSPGARSPGTTLSTASRALERNMVLPTQDANAGGGGGIQTPSVRQRDTCTHRDEHRERRGTSTPGCPVFLPSLYLSLLCVSAMALLLPD